MNILQVLTRPRVMIGMGLGLFTALAVLLIRALGFKLLLILMLLVVLGLIVAIVILVRQLQSARAAEEIEKTISRQADRDIERSVPGQVAEMRNLKADLLAAIEALKQSKFGKRAGQGVLSMLPWYMMVGPSGSGKSMLMRRSGLHFPLLDEKRAPRSVRGVGGTRSLEWWLSEEAVVLDMGGRTLGASAQFEDNDDWVAFLDTLRKQRKEKALNGVIVAVSLAEIAGKEEGRIDTLALSVRDRVQELVHHLGVVFPVYVVFTQCDQLSGFAEFFADLDAPSRTQPWGATFSPDRSREEDAPALFDEEYGHLAAALSDRRMGRLADVTDPVQRTRAFAFPLQLERVRPAMRRFLKVLFQPDPMQESPLFRGFYLASAVQEGVPVDRVLQPAATAIGIAAPAVTAPPAPVGDGAFFVHGLLADVVFGDAGLAVSSTRAEALKRRQRVLLFAGLGALLFVIGLVISICAAYNAGLVTGTRRAAEEVAQRVRPDTPLMENLIALDDLRKKVAIVDSLVHKKPFVRQIGAYAGDRLRDPSLQLYTEKLLEDLLAPAAQEMESRLTTLTDSNTGEFYDYYSLFRAWRLLSEPKQIQPADAPVLSREIRALLEGRLASTSPDDRERFPRLVQAHMTFLASHTDWLERLSPGYYRAANPDLVARAAARVRTTWDSSQFYRAMLAEVGPSTRPLKLSDLIGSNGMLSSTGTVPGPFTRPGWEKQVRPRIQWYRDQLQRDWVIGQAFQDHPPDLAHDLLINYARDYSAAWAQFLNSVNVQPPRDMGGVAEMLSVAAQSSSPVVKLLKAAGEQTSLGADPGSEAGQVQRDFAIARDFFASTGGGSAPSRATSAIGGLFDKMQGKSNPLDRNRTPLDVYTTGLRAVHDQVEKAGKPGAPASEMRALMSFGDEASNPTKSALAWIGTLTGSYPGSVGAAPVGRLLALPIFGLQQTAGGSMRPELNGKWAQQVVTPFRTTLAGKYPVTESADEATPFAFTEFFRPGGTFWTFYDHELKEFVTEDGKPRSQDGNVPVSADMIACLKHAYEIREALFTGGSAIPTLKFSVRASQPRIEGPHVNVRWVALDCGGKSARYSMGAPSWMDLEWPGADPTAGASLRLETSGGAPAESRNQPGAWGLFRLLDQGQAGAGDGGVPQLTWRVAAGPTTLHVIYDFQTAAARNPFRPGFLRFSLPESP